ncbi:MULTISPECIES: hypothetical protein [Nocardia]|uniref:hypothetical protein n=1 Tax=Nocardia TaxID=1817 RepID=UPI002454E4DC|nr:MULTISPECIES: hypothetical protein [Nocardia]
MANSSRLGVDRRGGPGKALRPTVLATFAKSELVDELPEVITPHIHSSQSS